MPRRRFVTRSARPRRKLVWARISGSQAVAVAAAPALAAPTRTDALLEFEQSLGASTVGATVVRTRGYISLSDPDRVAAVIAAARVTMYVGNNNEVTRGPNANDNAFDNLSQNKDYFLFEPFLVDNSNVDAQTGGTDTYSRIIDVKSSRKIEELNQTVILDASAMSPNAVDAGSLAFNFDLSLLLMLP